MPVKPVKDAFITAKETITTISKNISFDAALNTAMKVPGVTINRENFLRKELSKYFDDDVVEKAIETNPAQAGLSIKNLERISKMSINYETTQVTALSAAAGMPGGFAMIGTVPADIAQFLAHIIRILQKLAYLYGWQDMSQGDEDGLDDETKNQLTLFIGVMFGVNAANKAIVKIAIAIAKNIERNLIRKALTKGTIYPIVKSIAKIIGVKMTKEIFAKSVGKAIPIVGGVVSGGLTFIGFRPMAKRLQKYLTELPLASVTFYKTPREYENDAIIADIDFTDIIVEDLDDDDKTE